jgi:hypothetical protein
LVSMAFWTTPILAGVIREDLGGTFVAAPEMSAESLGAAAKDIGDGALMGWQYRRAMGRQIVVREVAENVRDLDHGGTAGSEAGHQSIEDGSQRNAGWLGQVGIDGSGGDIGVTEQNLNDPGINTIFQQTGRVTVAQDVRRHPLFDAGGGACVSEGKAQGGRVGWSGAVSIKKEPTRVAMDPPEVTQIVQQRSWQRHKPLLVALASDAQQHIGTVDRADFQVRGLAYAKTAGVHDGQASLVTWVSDAAQERTDLGIRQSRRQAPLLRRADPFFSQTAASRGRASTGRGIGCRHGWS